MPTSAKYGGVHDAATILQCSDKTVRRLVAEGAIPAYRMPGKSRLIRIRLDELEASLRLIPSGSVSSRAAG